MVAVQSRLDRLVRPTLGRHLLFALGAAVVLFLLSSQIGAYDDYNLTAVAIFAVAAAGLNLLTGLNGQLSLGHGALMAIGAYTASLLLKDHRQLPVIIFRYAFFLCPSKYCANTRYNFLYRKWLDDIIIGPRFQARYLIALGRLCR